MLPNLKLIRTNRPYLHVYSMLFEHNIGNLSVNVVGLDPGSKNIGIASVTWKYVNVYEIQIPRGETTEKRILDIWELLSTWLNDFKILVIEGASYADRYRQVELQDIRCGATAWAMNRPGHNVDVQIIPPNTIRKVVFGSAKIKNPWEEMGIPNNSAAALGCALYPIMKEKQNE